MTTISHSTRSLIESIPEKDRPVYQELLDTEVGLSKKCDDVAALDEKINKVSARITETSYEAENRSLARRVGYGFAGTAIALLCPISWGLGIIFNIFTLGGARMEEEVDMLFLFKAPVKLCGELFAKTFGSKEAFEDDLVKFTNEKNDLLTTRLHELDEVNQLDAQMNSQVKNISSLFTLNSSNVAAPYLMLDAIAVERKVTELKAKSDESKIEI
jgi:hypothetical protein